MRSIFLYLTSRSFEVKPWLASILPTTNQKGGYDFEIPGSPEPVGWVYLTDNVPELGESEMDAIERTLGASIGCIVVADISGKWASINEITQLASSVLCRFFGFAQDDYSDCLWSSSQLLSTNGEGRMFFRDIEERVIGATHKLRVPSQDGLM